jgi:hypothetical protein
MLAGMVRLREAVFGLLLGGLLWSGCTTNHDALAKQPPKAGAPAGGSAGSGGQASGNTGNLPSQGGRDNPDHEPMGDDVFTIVNGIVDAEGVLLCFARLDGDGQVEELIGEPSLELSYGTSMMLTEIEGFDLAEDALQPWVIAGDLSLVDGLSCEDALALAASEEAKVTPRLLAIEGAGGQGGATDTEAGGAGGEPSMAGAGGAPVEPPGPLEMPALRARPVAAIPPASLNIGRSILMVLSGCLGGAYYNDTDNVEMAACGAEYEPDSPTLQPIVVTLSREMSFTAVGLQAVQGALSVGSIDVRSSGDDGTTALTFASTLTFGAIEPRPADTRFSAAELGVRARDHGIQAIGGDGQVIFQQSWPDIRAASGLDEIIESRTYTAILVGPSPLLSKESWWNEPAFVLVENDPTRD